MSVETLADGRENSSWPFYISKLSQIMDNASRNTEI